MKEKKYWLTSKQIKFLESCMFRIDNGWSIYSYTTRCGIEDILECGYYRDTQREWLQNMRMDYIETYCTTSTTVL